MENSSSITGLYEQAERHHEERRVWNDEHKAVAATAQSEHTRSINSLVTYTIVRAVFAACSFVMLVLIWAEL
jgi:hypothetical protein